MKRFVESEDRARSTLFPERLSTEMALHVLAYNMKRVIQIPGLQQTMQLIRT